MVSLPSHQGPFRQAFPSTDSGLAQAQGERVFDRLRVSREVANLFDKLRVNGKVVNLFGKLRAIGEVANLSATALAGVSQQRPANAQTIHRQTLSTQPRRLLFSHRQRAIAAHHSVPR